MFKEEETQEEILKKYISENKERYSPKLLRKEAIERGYSAELFDRLLGEISLNENNSLKKEIIIKQTSGKRKESYFAPTNIMTYTFCIILLATAGFSLSSSFSLSSMQFQDVEGMGSSFDLGYPWVYISVSMDRENPFEFNFVYLIFSIALYLIISYIVDLIINNFIRALKSSVNEDLKEERLIEELENEEIEAKSNLKNKISKNLNGNIS